MTGIDINSWFQILPRPQVSITRRLPQPVQVFFNLFLAMSSCPYFLSQKFIRQLIFILFSSPLVLRRYGENAQTGSSVTLTLETFYMAKNCLVCAQVISERSRDLLCTDCLSAPSKSAFICHARKRNVEAQLRKMIDVCNSCGGYLTTTVSRSQWRKWFFSFFFFVMITILRMRNTGKWTISLFFLSLSLSRTMTQAGERERPPQCAGCLFSHPGQERYQFDHHIR